MSDELDSLPDSALNELFAVEIKEWDVRAHGLLWDRMAQRSHIFPDSVLHKKRVEMGLPSDAPFLVDFCADANAVLGHGPDWNVCFRDTTGKVFVTLWTPDGNTCVAEAEGRSFAHAYVKAIIRAKRASK